MNINFILSGSVEIPDSLLDMMEASGKSPSEWLAELVEGSRDAFPSFLADAQLIMGDDTPVRSGVSNRDAMRAVKVPGANIRATVPTKTVTATRSTTVARTVASQSADTDGMAPKKGRPPLKRDNNGNPFEASDGGSVSEGETGSRSVPVLKSQGIACRPIGSPWPKWYDKFLMEQETEEMDQDDEESDDDTESWTPAPRKVLPTPKSARPAANQPVASAPVMKRRTRNV